MHVSIHIIHVHIHIHIHMHIHKNEHTHVHKHMQMNTCIHVHVHVHVHIPIHKHLHIHIHARIHVQITAQYIVKQIQAKCVYICMQACILMCITTRSFKLGPKRNSLGLLVDQHSSLLNRKATRSDEEAASSAETSLKQVVGRPGQQVVCDSRIKCLFRRAVDRFERYNEDRASESGEAQRPFANLNFDPYAAYTLNRRPSIPNTENPAYTESILEICCL